MEFEDLTDDEFVGFMNSMNDKQKAKYNNSSKEAQQTQRQAYKQQLKYNGALSAAKGDTLQNSRAPQIGSEELTKATPTMANAAAHNEIVQDTLKGPEMKAKDGTEIKQGLGSVEGGDKPITERQAEEAEIAANGNAPVETGSVGASTIPTTEAAKKDPATRYKMKSIFEAYAEGEIDKSTRNYLIADTIGTFAKNLGKDIGNVAAAYSGGTMNNERDESLWSKRNSAMAQAGTEAEAAGVENSREYRQAEMDKLQRKAQNLENWNIEDSRHLANIVESTLYDKNGKLRYDPASKEFANITQQVQALRSGGAVNRSMLQQLMNWITHGTGF